MVGHGGSSVGSYLADPKFPIPSHCASIAVTSTLRVKITFSCFQICVLLTRVNTVVHVRSPLEAKCVTASLASLDQGVRTVSDNLSHGLSRCRYTCILNHDQIHDPDNLSHHSIFVIIAITDMAFIMTF